MTAARRCGRAWRRAADVRRRDGHRAGGAAHVSGHVPVMVGEVVRGLRPRPGARLVDATVGLGGHAAALLECGSRDDAPRRRSRSAGARDGRRARSPPSAHACGCVRARSPTCRRCWPPKRGTAPTPILLDLGVSSLQLDVAARGLQLPRRRARSTCGWTRPRSSAPRTSSTRWDEGALGDAILRELRRGAAGARRRARHRARPPARIHRATLADVVARVVGRGKPGLHPATRTFQALRIAVNDELGALERVPRRRLDAAPAGRPARHPRVPLARGPAREGGVPSLGGDVSSAPRRLPRCALRLERHGAHPDDDGRCVRPPRRSAATRAPAAPGSGSSNDSRRHA